MHPYICDNCRDENHVICSQFYLDPEFGVVDCSCSTCLDLRDSIKDDAEGEDETP